MAAWVASILPASGGKRLQLPRLSRQLQLRAQQIQSSPQIHSRSHAVRSVGGPRPIFIPTGRQLHPPPQPHAINGCLNPTAFNGHFHAYKIWRTLGFKSIEHHESSSPIEDRIEGELQGAAHVWAFWAYGSGGPKLGKVDPARARLVGREIPKSG
ncbi:hypothetical protein ACLOJK_028010 [Asimina triloba]